MSATAIPLRDWTAELRAQVADRADEIEIHPAALATLRTWLADMEATDDPAEVARLSAAIEHKLALEAHWR